MRRLLLRVFRLTRREYYADFFITPPLTIGLLALSAKDGVSFAWAAALGTGIIVWSLYEYLVHLASHHLWLLKEVHHLHHAHQRDYVATPPWATSSIYTAFWLAFGVQSSAFAVGFSLGYCLYSTAHTAFHYADVRGIPLISSAARRHALHHKFGNVNYGVTSPLWDVVFGTSRN